MFGLFKSKEEKLKEKQKEVDELNKRYSSVLFHWCKTRYFIFAPKRFEIINDSVCLVYIHKDTPEGYESYIPFVFMPEDLVQCRLNFISLRKELELLGLKIVKADEGTN